MIRNILILGGTGFVGHSLCEALVERSGGAGGRIVVPSRQPQRALHIRTLPTVEVVKADIHDEACLTQLLQGMDAVVNLVAILHGRDSAFQKVHVDLVRTLSRACQAAGVQRVVHVSALGVCDPPEKAPSHYLRSKGVGEQVLKTSHQLNYTILRPSVIFGEHDRFLNMFARLQTCLPLIALPGGSSQFQPVWVSDVAAAIVKVLDHPETAGQTIECAGPEVMQLSEIVRLAGVWSGHPRPVASLPLGLGYPQALLMELLPGTPLMSRDNVSSMKIPNVASGKLPGLQSLGITPSAMSSVMPDVLGHRLGPARLEAWRTPGPR